MLLAAQGGGINYTIVQNFVWKKLHFTIYREFMHSIMDKTEILKKTTTIL